MDRVFAIGPFGGRVSFASQQRRALNTVWALEQDGCIAAGSKVAVLGGGLAGVTAATALAARKCIVHLFESEQRILSVQQDTNHRFVHPTINFWPEMDLSPTTKFPFLDWHADKCSRIIDVLHDEWRLHFKKYITKTYLKSEVKKIETEDGLPFVVCAPGGDAPERSGPYKAVIMAMGFGRERSVKGLPFVSYWDRDELVDAEGSAPTKTVSGVGDGGLIDALRVVHREFRGGRLSLDLIEALMQTGIPNLLKSAEKAVRNKAGTDREIAAVEYQKCYQQILEDMPPVALEPLNRSLRDDLNEPVMMLGGTSTPYSLTAAPIHKLMLAHAISREVIEYKQANLADGPVLMVGGVKASLAKPCIVRHGPDPDLGGLLDKAQIGALRDRQMVLDDVLSDAHYDGSYWAAWSEYPQQNFTDPGFVALRYRSAADYVLHEFNLPLTQADDDGKASYYVSQDPKRPDLVRRVPPELYGIRTEVRPPRVFHA